VDNLLAALGGEGVPPTPVNPDVLARA